MKQILHLAILAGALIAASATLVQTAARAKVADTSKGKALVDAKGMALYTLSATRRVSLPPRANAPRTDRRSWPLEATGDPAKGRL